MRSKQNIFHLLTTLICLLSLLNLVNGVMEGDPCTNHADCDSGSTYLECDYTDKVCRCHAPDAWYDPLQLTCVLLEGAPCSLLGSQICGRNSFCLNDTIGSPSGRCRCTGDLKPNGNRMCFLEVGQICNPKAMEQCDTTEFIMCDYDRRVCMCPENWGGQQGYDMILEAGGRCRRAVNQMCTGSPVDVKCTTNANCIQTSNGQKCLCNDGTTPNSVGKCVLGYGVSCGPWNVGSCDAEGFQYCQQPEGRCLCHEESYMLYNNVLRQCEWRLDNQCWANSPISCPQHAICEIDVPPPYPPGIYGYCRCDAVNGWFNDGWGNCVQKPFPGEPNTNGTTALEGIGIEN